MAHETVEERTRIFVDSVLRNTHDSLKKSWQVVMGFSMIVAVQEVYAIMFDGSRWVDPTHDDWQAVTIAPLVFILTFIRFFLGDNRYLDLHYIELRQWGDKEEYLDDLKHTVSPTRCAIDVGLLLTHGIAFVFLAKSMGEPARFIGVYVVLWAAIVAWLYTMVSMNRRRKPLISRVESGLIGARREETESPRRDRTLEYWIRNNLACLLAVAGLYWIHSVSAMDRSSFQYICFGVVLANCLIDFWGTHQFYWPNLVDTYHDAIHELSRKTPPVGSAPPGTAFDAGPGTTPMRLDPQDEGPATASREVI
jgi:hypothetical protein